MGATKMSSRQPPLPATGKGADGNSGTAGNMQEKQGAGNTASRAKGFVKKDYNMMHKGSMRSREKWQGPLGGSLSKERNKKILRATTHSSNRKNRNRIRKDIARRRWWMEQRTDLPEWLKKRALAGLENQWQKFQRVPRP